MKNIEVYKAEKYDSDKYEEVKENITMILLNIYF